MGCSAIGKKNLMSSRGQQTRGGPLAYHVMNRLKRPRTWTDPLVRPKQWKRDMKFGISYERNKKYVH